MSEVTNEVNDQVEVSKVDVADEVSPEVANASVVAPVTVEDSTTVAKPPKPPKAPKQKKEPKSPKESKTQLSDRVTKVEALLNEVYEGHEGAHRDDLKDRVDALEVRVKTLEDKAVPAVNVTNG